MFDLLLYPAAMRKLMAFTPGVGFFHAGSLSAPLRSLVRRGLVTASKVAPSVWALRLTEAGAKVQRKTA